MNRTIEDLMNERSVFDGPTKKEQVKAFFSESAEIVKGKWKSSSAISKASVGTMAAGLLYEAMSSGGDSEVKKNRLIKEAASKKRTHNEFAFNMYNPEVYHGTGFHLWENIIQSHRY